MLTDIQREFVRLRAGDVSVAAKLDRYFCSALDALQTLNRLKKRTGCRSTPPSWSPLPTGPYPRERAFLTPSMISLVSWIASTSCPHTRSAVRRDAPSTSPPPSPSPKNYPKIARNRSRRAAGHPTKPECKTPAKPPVPDDNRPTLCRRKSSKPPISKRPTSTASRSIAASRIKPAVVN